MSNRINNGKQTHDRGVNINDVIQRYNKEVFNGKYSMESIQWKVFNGKTFNLLKLSTKK